MKAVFLILIACQFNAYCQAQQAPPSKEIQIKTALLACPKDKVDGATVFGYGPNQQLVLLRKGSNELICLADDPSQPAFSVACYHRDLEPFMERGRQLKKEGRSTKEIFDTRESEVKAGKLIMPKYPTTLYVYSGKDENYDRVSGEVKDGYLRYVIYTPFATSETTGLPTAGSPGTPWIMHPGTHGAHIMINPPMQK
jgi:hypothetical protein